MKLPVAGMEKTHPVLFPLFTLPLDVYANHVAPPVAFESFKVTYERLTVPEALLSVACVPLVEDAYVILLEASRPLPSVPVMYVVAAAVNKIVQG